MSNEELVEYKKYVDETMHSIFSKINDDEKELLNILIQQFNMLCEKQNKAIDYIKKEITCYSDSEIDDLIDILQGSDKE
ncbi:MAG TPA: hypothetical protein DCW44_02765 [Eubacterium sp.]|nr:hypothetical protein [Eubacterium sp.]